MNIKLVLIISFVCILPINAQQLSPVQLQKAIDDFNKALAEKRYDNAETYMNQIEKGGRAANAMELKTKLAKIMLDEAKTKIQAELHKVQKTQAADVEQAKKYEQTITNLKTETETLKKQLEGTKKDLEELKKAIPQPQPQPQVPPQAQPQVQPKK